MLEDSIHFIAKLPTLAATIYRQTYYRGNLIDREPGSDWAGGLAQMMGFPAPEAKVRGASVPLREPRQPPGACGRLPTPDPRARDAHATNGTSPCPSRARRR